MGGKRAFFPSQQIQIINVINIEFDSENLVYIKSFCFYKGIKYGVKQFVSYNSYL
jgi:hypothetical protein